jgi:hypothetical protein
MAITDLRECPLGAVASRTVLVTRTAGIGALPSLLGASTTVR